jgi:hypothetical protein
VEEKAHHARADATTAGMMGLMNAERPDGDLAEF